MEIYLGHWEEDPGHLPPKKGPSYATGKAYPADNAHVALIIVYFYHYVKLH